MMPFHPLPMLLEPDPLFLTNFFLDAASGAAQCRQWALCPLASPFPHSALELGKYNNLAENDVLHIKEYDPSDVYD